MSVYTTADQVAAEVRARLETIRQASGFRSDIGRQVYEGKLAIDEEMIPCASLIEGVDDVQNGPSQRVVVAHIKQQFAAVAYDVCDPDRPNTRAREMIADIKRALFVTAGKPDATWGGKVRAVRYRGRSIGPRADGAAFVMALVEFEVEYAEDLTQA